MQGLELLVQMQGWIQDFFVGGHLKKLEKSLKNWKMDKILKKLEKVFKELAKIGQNFVRWGGGGCPPPKSIPAQMVWGLK